jgi:hypothetical protein
MCNRPELIAPSPVARAKTPGKTSPLLVTELAFPTLAAEFLVPFPLTAQANQLATSDAPLTVHADVVDAQLLEELDGARIVTDVPLSLDHADTDGEPGVKVNLHKYLVEKRVESWGTRIRR